jgi:hypothetical protein
MKQKEVPNPNDEETNKRHKIDDDYSDGLKHLMKELDRSGYMANLESCGITSVQDLLEKEPELKKLELDLKKPVQKLLFQFCEWYKDFYGKNSHSEDWKQLFDEEKLEAFSSQRSPEELLAYAKSLLRSKNRPKTNITETDVKRMVDFTATKIIKALPTDLKNKCHFNIMEYAQLWIKGILDMPSFSNTQPGWKPDVYLAFGRTQAGKSVLKAVLCAICEELEVDIFIITKGVGESRDLAKKIKLLLQDSRHGRHSLIEDGVVTVVADTGAQILKLVKKIRHHRDEAKKKGLDLAREFVVVADECDAYVRTEGGSQVMERAYNDLMGLGPVLRI